MNLYSIYACLVVLMLSLALGACGETEFVVPEPEDWSGKYRDPALVGMWSLVGSRTYWSGRLMQERTQGAQVTDPEAIRRYYYDTQGKVQVKAEREGNGDYYVVPDSNLIKLRLPDYWPYMSDLSYQVRADSLIIKQERELDSAPYVYYLYYVRTPQP